MNEAKLLTVVLVLGAVLLAMIFGMPILVDKTTKNVIQELRSGRYSPGPYTPGFDPDMVNPNFFRDPSKKATVRPSQPKVAPKANSSLESWQTSWEAERN